MRAQLHSCVQLFATPWTIAYQVPLSMGFPRREYWSGLPFPSPGDPPYPGIKFVSPALQVVSCMGGRFFTTEPADITVNYNSPPQVVHMVSPCNRTP